MVVMMIGVLPITVQNAFKRTVFFMLVMEKQIVHVFNATKNITA
jgi:hypothetical protein